MRKMFLLSCVFILPLVLSACADTSDIANESLKKEAKQTYDLKAAECNTNYPKRQGNYYRRAMCQDIALLNMMGVVNPSEVRYIEVSVKVKESVSQKMDSGEMSEEDAKLVVSRSSSEEYAKYLADTHQRNQEINERKQEASTRFFRSMAIAMASNPAPVVYQAPIPMQNINPAPIYNVSLAPQMPIQNTNPRPMFSSSSCTTTMSGFGFGKTFNTRCTN